MIRTKFALVVRQTPKCVYLKILPQIETYEDSLRYTGTTVHDLMKINEYYNLSTNELIRAKVYWKEDGTFDSAVCRDESYWLWNGEPKHFDHMD